MLYNKFGWPSGYGEETANEKSRQQLNDIDADEADRQRIYFKSEKVTSLFLR